MSESQNFGFAKLVPGFDFLQNLAKGAAGGLPQVPQMAQLSSWVAPTLNVEELDKRIQELKAVHFWLEQNGKALAATIQALEVQKMTLSTLQGMNLSMTELAESLKIKPVAATTASAATRAAPQAEPAASQAASGASTAASSAKGRRPAAAKAARGAATSGAKGAGGFGGAVDPMQWWGALSQQFQQIAASALSDAGVPAAAAAASAPAKKAPARKAPSRAASASRRRSPRA